MALATASLTSEKDENMSETGTQAHAIDIYSALSKKDSFVIFCLASTGIEASTRVLEQYEFSRKRYYVRLKQLIDIGLVQKEGRFYKHTALGKMVYENVVKGLQQFLSGAGPSSANALQGN